MARHAFAFAFAILLLGAGCQQGGDGAPLPGDAEDAQPYAGIDEGETVRFTGTEPFWSGEVSGGTLTYSTPENREGAEIPVDRFAGRNGVSWSGTYAGAPFALAVTPGECRDGMSGRAYPFFAMLEAEGENREGCAWTDAHPATGPESAAN